MSNTASNRARRNKMLGRQGQEKVRQILLEAAPELSARDITSRPMGSPGEDLILSQAAYERYPFDIEVKYGKQINLIRACQQAAAESRNDDIPLAVGCYRLEKPEQWYVALKIEDFLKILGEKE